MNATVADIKRSRFPAVIGACQTDTGAICSVLNEATQRLIFASGEGGFWGCWRRFAMNVDRDNPYIVLPRQFARVINLDVCRTPMRIQNSFFEFLPGGIGLQDPSTLPEYCGLFQGYERDPVPTQVSIASTGQLVRASITDSRDVGKRVLISGKDSNGNEVYTTDGNNNVRGLFMVLEDPFVTSAFVFSEISAFQKDTTWGDVVLQSVDETTGETVTLSRYGPTEINPSYRRYLLQGLPAGCCCPSTGAITITGIAKMEYVPVFQDTDQLIISNIPALVEEAQAIRYSSMDVGEAALLESKHHRKAIRLLQDEMRHYCGEQTPAVTVQTFQPQALINHRIGYMI